MLKKKIDDYLKELRQYAEDEHKCPYEVTIYPECDHDCPKCLERFFDSVRKEISDELN